MVTTGNDTNEEERRRPAKRRLTTFDELNATVEQLSATNKDYLEARVMSESQSFIARSEHEREVEARTADLQRLNDELRAEIAELKRVDDINRRLAWIVESTDDAVLSRTPEGIITSWNKGAEQIFGFRAEELIGRHISTIIPDDRTDEVKDIIDSARRGEAGAIDFLQQPFSETSLLGAVGTFIKSKIDRKRCKGRFDSD